MKTHQLCYRQYYLSPVGWIELTATENGLCGLIFVEQGDSSTEGNRHTDLAISQLREYFAGNRQAFSVPLLTQGTEFQQQVWSALVSIPFGMSTTYGQIASQIEKPKAVRAVGAANGRNPISILIPCHRVIGKNGSLTGYAWGTDIKAKLLAHEAKFS